MKPGAVTVPIALRDINDSPVTGATLACTVSIDGGAFAPATNSAVEVGGGDYALALTAAERGTSYTRVKATDGTYTTLVTVTTDDVMRGTDGALLAADYTAPDNASVGAIKAKTDGLPADTAGAIAALPTDADVQAAAQAAIVAQPATLTSEYDHAKDDVLTPLAAVDGKVDAIKERTDTLKPDEGVLITPESIGDDGLPLGRIMPYGTISAYIGDALQYRFDKIGDADGDFAITLPYGSTWTLVAENPPAYRATTAVITTPPQP